MSDFTELYAVSSAQALEFFIYSLHQENLSIVIPDDETDYIASVLAHYAQTPRYTTDLCSGSFLEVLDTFFFHPMATEGCPVADPELLEIAGAQTLFLGGFFRDQVRRRHNPTWCDQMGQSFYCRAGNGSHGARRDLFYRIGDHFSLWAETCNQLRRNLQANPYVIHVRPE